MDLREGDQRRLYELDRLLLFRGRLLAAMTTSTSLRLVDTGPHHLVPIARALQLSEPRRTTVRSVRTKNRPEGPVEEQAGRTGRRLVSTSTFPASQEAGATGSPDAPPQAGRPSPSLDDIGDVRSEVLRLRDAITPDMGYNGEGLKSITDLALAGESDAAAAQLVECLQLVFPVPPDRAHKPRQVNTGRTTAVLNKRRKRACEYRRVQRLWRKDPGAVVVREVLDGREDLSKRPSLDELKEHWGPLMAVTPEVELAPAPLRNPTNPLLSAIWSTPRPSGAG